MNFVRFNFIDIILCVFTFVLFFSCSSDQVVRLIPIEKKGILYENKNNFESLVICQKGNLFYINGNPINGDLTKEIVMDEIKSLDLSKNHKGLILNFINSEVEYESYLITYNLLVAIREKYLNEISFSQFKKKYENLNKAERKKLGVFITINDNDINQFSSDKEKNFCI